jgi:hypothetical protein
LAVRTLTGSVPETPFEYEYHFIEYEYEYYRKKRFSPPVNSEELEWGDSRLSMLMSFVFVVVVMAVFIVAWPESRWIVGKGATVPCGFTAIENLLNQLAMELAVSDPHLGIELAIEVLTAIDPGLFAACAD